MVKGVAMSGTCCTLLLSPPSPLLSYPFPQMHDDAEHSMENLARSPGQHAYRQTRCCGRAAVPGRVHRPLPAVHVDERLGTHPAIRHEEAGGRSGMAL